MCQYSLRERKIRLLFITAGIFILGLLLYVLARLELPIPCLFYKITGFRCPGCGNTRAALALLRLNFSAAFFYNPAFLPEVTYLLWVYLRSAHTYLRTGIFTYHSPLPFLDKLLLLLLILWWIIRNILQI